MEDPIDSKTITDLLEIIKPVKDTFWEEGIPENFDRGSVPQYND